MQLEQIAKEILVPLLALFHQFVEKVAVSSFLFKSYQLIFMTNDVLMFQTGY